MPVKEILWLIAINVFSAIVATIILNAIYHQKWGDNPVTV